MYLELDDYSTYCVSFVYKGGVHKEVYKDIPANICHAIWGAMQSETGYEREKISITSSTGNVIIRLSEIASLAIGGCEQDN